MTINPLSVHGSHGGGKNIVSIGQIGTVLSVIFLLVQKCPGEALCVAVDPRLILQRRHSSCSYMTNIDPLGDRHHREK